MSVDTLYIIGNGFDLAHQLLTSYGDFREYLEKKATAEEEMREMIKLLITVIDKHDAGENAEAGDKGKWSGLEEYCGKIELKDADISLSDRSYFDEEGEEHEIPYSWEEKGAEVDGFVKSIDALHVLFGEWIDICGGQEQMKLAEEHKIDYFTGKLRDSDYAILCFNYTDTLEQLYGVEENRICHIHGKRGTRGKYYFGHGKKGTPINQENSLRSALKYMDSISDSEGRTYFPNVDISKKLFKDTQEAYNSNKAFFDGLSGVKNIYVYGYSFGQVDCFYMIKINEKAPEAEWHIHQYGEDAADKYCKVKCNLLKINKDMKIKFWDPDKDFGSRDT